jgi:hypothetical protein
MPEREISYRGETGFVSGYGLRHAVGAAIDLGFLVTAVLVSAPQHHL